MNDYRYTTREPASGGPGVLTVLVVLNCVVYLLRLFAVPGPPGAVTPGALSMDALLRGEWWSAFTWIVTHLNVWHLLTNMALLVLAGRAVQRTAGQQHFLYIFLAGAWAGAILCLLLRPSSALIGASGGVWAVIGAFIALHPEYDLMRPFRRWVPLRLKARRLFPAFLATHLCLEAVVQLFPDATWGDIARTAHLVHAGGLLTGWIYGWRLTLSGEASGGHSWSDFFPQGLRRRLQDEKPDRLPVPAHSGPQQQQAQESPAPQAEVPAELSDKEFLRERVDPVLEKLYAQGADTLTPEDRLVLEEASRRFSRPGH